VESKWEVHRALSAYFSLSSLNAAYSTDSGFQCQRSGRNADLHDDASGRIVSVWIVFKAFSVVTKSFDAVVPGA